MKISLLFLCGFSLAVPVLSHAQTVVTYVNTFTLEGAILQPGSATDFIDFCATNYPTGGPSKNQDALGDGTVTADLNSFTINGGVRAENSGGNSTGGNFSIITTPLGQSFLTGALIAEPGLAFALTPGVQLTANGPYVLNPNFNYNDFNVYLMFSNTNNTPENGDRQKSILQDQTISIDPRGGTTTVSFGTHDQTVADNTNATTPPGGSIGASPTSAQYIEFHVTGLADAIATQPDADLVVGVNLPSNFPIESYIGGVSFESVPEPATGALVAGSVGWLGWSRRRRVRVEA